MLLLTAVLCVISFYHPGLAPLIAFEQLGAKPDRPGPVHQCAGGRQHRGWAGAATQQQQVLPTTFLTLGGFGPITAIAQLGMSCATDAGFSLAMAFLIGAGTAGLLSSCNLITQIGSPQEMRGRMAGLSQIAFLGGGGFSGLLASTAGEEHRSSDNVRPNRRCQCRSCPAVDAAAGPKTMALR